MVSSNNTGNISKVCLERTSLDTDFFRADPNIPGAIAIFVFYGVVLLVGVYATYTGNQRRKKSERNVSDRDHVMLADRSLGVVIGIFTLSGTSVGGGFINGTVENIFTPGFGLVWLIAPFFYQVAVVISIPFALRMKKIGYHTLLDPFEVRYGQIHTAFNFIIVLLADVFWAGTNLAALGTCLSVIIGVNYIWSVMLSAAVATLYTVIGGLYSVAYTDVIQLILIFSGLWLTVPFAWMNDAVTDITVTAHSENSWLGQLEVSSIGLYIDIAWLSTFGGVVWQEYFMRALALKAGSKGIAAMTLIAAGIILTLIIPRVLIGGIAASTDWNATGYRDFGEIPVPECDYALMLPLVMRFLTPVAVGIIGLAAVSAGVMSSTDSAILSASSMFANNIYVPFRNAISRCCSKSSKASDKEIVWVMRVAVLLMGASATLVAIRATSIYDLYVLAFDLVCVSVFPQFFCSLFVPFTNFWGAVSGFWLGIILRLLCGEPFFGVPALIKFPWYDESTDTQMFPFRTLITILNLVVILGVSVLARAVCGVDNPKCMTTFAVNEMTQADISASEKRNKSATEDLTKGEIFENYDGVDNSVVNNESTNL